MQTYSNLLSLTYLGELISLPIIHDVNDPKWLPEFQEYIQDTLDQFPIEFKETYIPAGYITTAPTEEEVTHQIIFVPRDSQNILQISDTIKEKIQEIFYDPCFSGFDKPQVIQTQNLVIIISNGYN